MRASIIAMPPLLATSCPGRAPAPARAHATDAPAPVAATASAPGRITEAELMVTATGVAFEVEVTGPAGSVELMIDAAGAVVDDQPDDDDHDDHDDGDHG